MINRIDEKIHNQIIQYVYTDIDELYRLLVTKDDSELYSKSGLIGRGKEIYSALVPKIQLYICRRYLAHASNTANAIEAATLIASILLGTTIVGNIPVFPLAAIIAKIGIEEFCKNTNKKRRGK